MSLSLTKEIIIHVYKNLGLIQQSEFNTDSLISNKYFLNDYIKYEEDNVIKESPIYGCIVKTLDKDMIIVYCDHYLIVKIKNSVTYGLSLDKIYFTINEKDWLECQVYFQATFLAGMEQIKQIGLNNLPLTLTNEKSLLSNLMDM